MICTDKQVFIGAQFVTVEEGRCSVIMTIKQCGNGMEYCATRKQKRAASVLMMWVLVSEGQERIHVHMQILHVFANTGCPWSPVKEIKIASR